MTIIRLDGASVALAGSVKGYSGSALWAHLKAQGASVSDNPTKDADMMLVGANPSYTKVDKAKSLGLTLIEGDALHTLLEEGELELEEAPVRPLAELIADARAVFDGPPSRQAWASICALADECDDAHIDDFVAYLTPQLDAWPRVLSYARVGYDFQVGPFTHAAGEGRVMPSSWFAALLNGEQHAKHRLATAITFSTTAVNNTISMGIFDNPDMAHIRTFDVGSNLSQNVKKKNFYKKMASCPHLTGVDTLMLSTAPKGAYVELASATSLPNLRRILVRSDLYRSEADLEVAVFGPWAPQLECVGVTQVGHLEMLAARVGELPALDTLAIGMHTRTELELFVGYARAIRPLLDQLREVQIGMSSMDDGGNEGLGVLLDGLDTELDVLDLRASGMMSLEGPIGVAFATKHIVANGLGARVGELIVGENVSAEVCAALREAGVNVTSPLDDSPGALDAAAFEFIEDLAPGEAERVAAHQVHLHDAMMFSAPSTHAWSTLTGVVDGLERQLEPDAFAEAIDTLLAHLEQWPDGLRELPERWFGELLAGDPSPKIRLARSLTALNSYHDAKGVARFWGAIAAAGNVNHVNVLKVAHAGKQKFFLAAMEELFEAVRPSAYAIFWSGNPEVKALKAALSGKGLLPDPNPGIEWPSQPFSADIDAMKMREVSLVVASPGDLQRVFDHVELDHVVSLDLKFDPPWREDVAPGWDHVIAKPASFKRLRHLGLRLNGRVPVDVFAPLVTWLSEARPVHVDDSFSGSAPYDTPVMELIEAGVYARTHGSSVELPLRVSQEQAVELFGREDVHLAGVSLMYGGYSVPDTLDLVGAMHPSLRQGIMSLKWPTTPKELTQIDELLSMLPALSTWTPICPALRTREGRAPMFAALAASPASKQLAQVRTVGAYGEQAKSTAAELKVLDRGAGMTASGWIMSNL